jgi:hypothetical protein
VNSFLGYSVVKQARRRKGVKKLEVGEAARASRGSSVTWLGRWDWQVIQQIKKRRRYALSAEHAYLCHVSRLVNYQVPQQAIHGVPLPGPVMHTHNPFQLVGRQRGEVREGALLDNPPLLQQRFEGEIRINGAARGVLQGGNALPQRLFAQDLLVNPEVLGGGYVKHEVFDGVTPT